MKNLLLIAVSIVALFYLSNCHKEVPKKQGPDAFCALCESCYYLPPDTLNGLGREVVELFFERKAPCFNPLNDNEFVYVKLQDSMHESNLVKYNLTTHIETILLNKVDVFGQPKWGANGWIIFDALNLQIYKIKDNGDSLTQLTWIFGNSYPDIYGLDKFICSVNSSNNLSNYGIKIIDNNGNRLDSINYKDLNGGFRFNSVNNIGEIAGTNYYNILTYNIQNKALIEIMPKPALASSAVYSICWHPNNEDIFYSTIRVGTDNPQILGINKINKNNKINTLIKKGCSSRGYGPLSISKNGQKILVERINATLVNIYRVEFGSDIYMMDIDGSNEHKVFP